MPSHLLARCSWQFNDSDPKNQAVINPCFRRQIDWSDPTSDLDAKQLGDDLLAALASWSVPVSDAGLQVKIYDLEGDKPNYPKYSTPPPTGFQAVLGVPQQAICLSFYSGQNQPRKRGRLYVPAWLTTSATSELASSVITSNIRTKVSGLVSVFAQLGGTNVDWIVWSRVAQSAGKVDHWFVDESWDIIRSRKLKSTQRTTGTTGG